MMLAHSAIGTATVAAAYTKIASRMADFIMILKIKMLVQRATVKVL